MEPVNTEYAYQISAEEERQLLQNDFNYYYRILPESRLVPEAVFETAGDLKRSLTGIPSHYFNAVFGYPDSDWEECIDEQLRLFHAAKMPFVWYVDEDASEDFKSRLKERGFQDSGILRGVIGLLDKVPEPVIPDGYVLEKVMDEAAMAEFIELLSQVFSFPKETSEPYKKALWEGMKSRNAEMVHWLVRKDGRVVSVLSTIIKGDIVGFWNGATTPELQRQGLSTALRCHALQEAVSKGCRRGTSYLMAEGMAFGICSRLGYETRWRFHAFLSPSQSHKDFNDVRVP